MAIPALNNWQDTTRAARFLTTSPAMGIIDDKIRAYWQAGADVSARNAAAYAIRKACRHFIASSPSRLSSINDSVRNLETQAEGELTAHQPGWTEFAANKAQGRGVLLKPLAPGYAHERRQYVAEGKASNPISASVLRDAALADAPVGTNPHVLITNMDDQTWNGYARPGGVMRAGGAGNEVLFFDKRERLEHMLIVNNGRLEWARDGSTFVTPPGQPFMYAMDAYGNLFAKNDNLGATQFNHSSFNAGREVVCAGMIAGGHGRLYFIDNNSGHYQPSRQDLWSCVNKLRNAGVHMSFPSPNQPAPRIGTRVAPVVPMSTVRVSVHGVGDWPYLDQPGIQGFEHIGAATNGAPPAPIPPNPTYLPWP